MIIGVDFDNTLVCYDKLLHALALEHHWITPNTPAIKTVIRDTMRAHHLEKKWVILQGLAYGRDILRATPFPGTHDFFTACNHHHITLYIISHKTQTPASGQPFNLHDAARQWLITQNLIHHTTQRASLAAAIPPSHVFFEPTRDAKLARIAALQCDHFIDDLPEFLAAFHTLPALARVKRWLFDPASAHTLPRHAATTIAASPITKILRLTDMFASLHTSTPRPASATTTTTTILTATTITAPITQPTP